MKCFLDSYLIDIKNFNEFIKYHLLNCERFDLLGSSAHLLDILKKG